MNKNQKGFGAVEALVLIVIAGIIGLSGWYVLSRNNSDVSQNKTPTKNEQVKKTQAYQPTTSVPADWKTFENQSYKIKFSYPSNLEVSDSLMTKKIGEEVQNVYSTNATEIYVICLREAQDSQMCVEQININNQPFSQSLAQLRKYYKATSNEYKETELVRDGHKLVEFQTEGKAGNPDEKNYYLDANSFTYGLTTVTVGDPKPGTEGPLSTKDKLILFESIKIQ